MMIGKEGCLLMIYTSSRTVLKLKVGPTWPTRTLPPYPGSVFAILKLNEDRVTDCAYVAKGAKGADGDTNCSIYVTEPL